MYCIDVLHELYLLSACLFSLLQAPPVPGGLCHPLYSGEPGGQSGAMCRHIVAGPGSDG